MIIHSSVLKGKVVSTSMEVTHSAIVQGQWRVHGLGISYGMSMERKVFIPCPTSMAYWKQKSKAKPTVALIAWSGY